MKPSVLVIALMGASLFGAGDASATTQHPDELPLPADVYRVSEPMEITMGQQPIAVQSFSTRLTPEQLRVFYADALAKQGWTIESLPGMDELARHQATMNQMMETHRKELEQDPALKAKLEGLQAVHPAELMNHQVHAVRGTRHLVIHSATGDRGKTIVFLNRWEDRGAAKAASGEGGLGTASSQTGAGWPAANPCCSGEAVPTAFRKLPSSVPQYPKARMVDTGATTALMSELYFSPDSPAQIAAYYREHMAYNGWKSTKDTGTDHPEIRDMLGEHAASMNANLLTYRSDQAYCGIVVAERAKVQHLPGVAEDVDTTSRDPEGPTSKERSIIMITYLAIPSPQRPSAELPRRVGGSR